MIELSEGQEEYSGYIQVGANLSNILVLLSGFTFTAITILLSQFQALDNLTSQFILFFLACLFFLFIELLGVNHFQLLQLCKNVPPVTRDLAIFNRLVVSSWILLQLTVVLMFLIWNLVYLSLASGIMLALILLSYLPRLKGRGRFSEQKEHEN